MRDESREFKIAACADVGCTFTVTSSYDSSDMKIWGALLTLSSVPFARAGAGLPSWGPSVSMFGDDWSNFKHAVATAKPNDRGDVAVSMSRLKMFMSHHGIKVTVETSVEGEKFHVCVDEYNEDDVWPNQEDSQTGKVWFEIGAIKEIVAGVDAKIAESMAAEARSVAQSSVKRHSSVDGWSRIDGAPREEGMQ